MNRNIEIKARVDDPAGLRRAVERIADGPAEVIEQTDHFFRTPNGRLKLREFPDGTGEMIYYERSDSSGPRQSSYVRAPTPTAASMLACLTGALGMRATVRKRRTLFRVGRTRIHLDEVESLGSFIELEVVLGPNDPADDGVAEAEHVMTELGIETSALESKAYVDLLAP